LFGYSVSNTPRGDLPKKLATLVFDQVRFLLQSMIANARFFWYVKKSWVFERYLI
jgi:hypothetical protein